MQGTKKNAPKKNRVERGAPGSREARGAQGNTDKRGKREFDRRSTQRNDGAVKKGGAGSHNWGKDGDNAEKASREGSATAAAQAADHDAAAAYLQREALVHGRGKLEPTSGMARDAVASTWMTRAVAKPRF